jgi:hypothetical protein
MGLRRGTSYVEADLCKDLIPRERLYVKRKTDFKKSGRWSDLAARMPHVTF